MGNLDIKIHITKAFDRISWDIFIKVLRQFGLSPNCHWISSILDYARIFVAMNESLHGYFSYKRGVILGDPLSLIHLCLAEEVLCRNISKLASEGSLILMKATNSVNIPIHMYADEFLILCQGKTSYILMLNQSYFKYSHASGQAFNNSKSTFFLWCHVQQTN